MNRIMHRVRWVSALWAMAIVFLAESPSVLFIENAARIRTTQEINQIGILCIVRFVLAGLVAFAIGVLLFFGMRRTIQKVSSSDYLRIEAQKNHRSLRLIFGLVVALLPLFSVAEPAVNLFTKRGLEAELVEAYWIWLFLVAAIVLWIVGFSLIRFFLVKHIQVEVDEEIPDRKSHRKLIPIFLVLLFVIVVSGILVMRNGSWLLQPYVASIPAVEHPQHDISYDRDSGVYTIETGNEDFRILQLTDIHLGGSIVSAGKDRAALEAIYTLVESQKPDLIIITGDSVFPLGVMSFSLNNYVPMIQLASFMRNLGVPWTITFGNHDTEGVATHNATEISEVFDRFSFEKTRSLLYPETQPDIYGRSNQMILLKNSDETIREALFLIDSNDYQSNAINDYDYIHEDQVQWYQKKLTELEALNGEMPDSLLFFHIPLQEYQTAYDLYKAKSSEVEYHFGVVGEENEAICASNIHSSLFDTAVALGSTKGMFCGHDHYNNISLTYRGIRLTYGMSIDYLAMPGISKRDEQRGGTLITVHPDSSFEVEQVPLRTVIADD